MNTPTWAAAKATASPPTWMPRDYVIASLDAVGSLQSTRAEAGVGFIAASRNAQGNPYFTDGKIVMAVLVEAK